MAKLINTHLNKSPEELTAAELASLLDWIKSMAHFLEEDKVKVENYMAELLNLTHEKRSDSEA